MDPSGFEPEAPALQGRSSTRLSYRPVMVCNADLKKNMNEDCKKKKEVIQPQVPLRLPCDDLTLLTELRFDLPKEVSLT